VLDEVVMHVKTLCEIDATLDPANGTAKKREEAFAELAAKLAQDADPIRIHMSKVMHSFEKGLFAGGDDPTLPRDNLDLERFFRRPKGHERRIHGRSHAGTRIVHRGPTLILALDAHERHPEPFSADEIIPWRDASPPEVLLNCRYRSRIMRQARSSKCRPALLVNLETRFNAASSSLPAT
jgi:hypothetical protein